jgi:SRSO17 transposase
VFAAYVSDRGCAFIDRQLYRPQAWIKSPKRRAAHMPSDIRFAIKPEIGAEMIARAVAAGALFAWVATDTVSGIGEIEMLLRRAAKGYVLGVRATDQFNSWGANSDVAGTAAQALAPEAWQRLSRAMAARGLVC